MKEIKELEITAKSRQGALEKAYQQFQEQEEKDFAKEEIELEFIKEEKGFLGIFGGEEIYKAILEVGEEGVAGELEVIVREAGIFLTVQQPENGGEEVKLYQVEEALEEKEIVEVDYEAVSDALTRDEEEVKIAERKPELDRDAEVEVKVSNDKLEAYLDYIPALGGEKITTEEVLERVREEGVVFGIREEEFKEEFEQEQELKEFLIAEGEEVIPGKDGEIELNFDLERKERKVNIQEDGSADFYNLDRIINVDPEDVLAKKIPPKEGELGTTVTGEEIKPDPVIEAAFKPGENVKISEDGTELISEIEGQVVKNNEQISVVDTHQVNGNVNLSTGNIDFSGSVHVKGDVEEGMEVKAEGNVTIEGSVHKADIEAEGQVIIAKGLIGGNQGKVTAKGDVEVKFIENGVVETKGSLSVKDAIMHSNIDAREEVEVTQGKGLIVGGEVRAGHEIKAVTMGSNLATPTEISVGITPQLRDEHNQIESQLKDKQSKLDETIKNINQLKKIEKKGELTKRREELLNQLVKQRYTLSKEVEEVKSKERELSDLLEESNEARIKVEGTIYSGVTLTIGKSCTRIDNDNSYVIFYEDEGKIKSSSYK